MPVTIPHDYPVGSSDEELSRVLDELLHEYITWGGDVNHGADIVSAGDARFDSMISMGQLELQKRFLESNNSTTNALHNEIKSLKKITEDYGNSSEKFSNASKLLSKAAIFIAIAAILVTVILTIISNNENSRWQNNQLEILTKIENNTAK